MTKIWGKMKYVWNSGTRKRCKHAKGRTVKSDGEIWEKSMQKIAVELALEWLEFAH